MKIFRFSMYQ